MAFYVVSFADKHDKVCKTYTEALGQKGWTQIYCAPDRCWQPGHPEKEGEYWVCHYGEPVRAKYVPCGTGGFYLFLGYGNCAKSTWKCDGWLPMDWLTNIAPVDEAEDYLSQPDDSGDKW